MNSEFVMLSATTALPASAFGREIAAHEAERVGLLLVNPRINWNFGTPPPL